MVNVVFAKRLKMAIENKGCFNIDIAKAIGVDKSQITRYLAGSQPRGDRVIKIAQYLGVSPDWLVGADIPARLDYYMQEFSQESELATATTNLTALELKTINEVASDQLLKARLLQYAQKLHAIMDQEDDV